MYPPSAYSAGLPKEVRSLDPFNKGTAGVGGIVRDVKEEMVPGLQRSYYCYSSHGRREALLQGIQLCKKQRNKQTNVEIEGDCLVLIENLHRDRDVLLGKFIIQWRKMHTSRPSGFCKMVHQVLRARVLTWDLMWPIGMDRATWL